MPNYSQDNKRIARNTFFLYVRMLVVMFLSFYTTRIVLRVLGVEDYGIYNIVGGFVSMLAVLNSCLTTGTNRFFNVALGEKDTHAISQVYTASLIIQVILIAVILIVGETVGLWYVNNEMVIPAERLAVANWLYQFSLLSLVFLIIQIPYSSAILAYERMDYYAIVSVIDAIFKLATALAVLWIDYDHLLAYGILMLLVSFIRFVLYYLYCKKNFIAIKVTRDFDKDLFKRLFSFSGWSILDPFSYIFRDQGSNVVLNLFFGPVVNAAYGISSQASGAVSSFASNLSVAFRPQIIQSYSAQEYSRAKRLMISMSKINFILQSLFALPIIFEISQILHIWLGPDYPQYTEIFAVLVIAINTINTLNEPVSIIMVASGHIKKIKSISLLIICSVVPIGYVLFHFGCQPYVIYIIMLILTIINQISCVNIMTKEIKDFKVTEYVKNVAFPCFIYAILSLIVPAIIVYVLPESMFRIIVTGIGVIISSSLIAYNFCLDESERPLLAGVFNKIFSKVKIRIK